MSHFALAYYRGREFSHYTIVPYVKRSKVDEFHDRTAAAVFAPDYLGPAGITRIALIPRAAGGFVRSVELRSLSRGR